MQEKQSEIKQKHNYSETKLWHALLLSIISTIVAIYTSINPSSALLSFLLIGSLCLTFYCIFNTYYSFRGTNQSINNYFHHTNLKIRELSDDKRKNSAKISELKRELSGIQQMLEVEKDEIECEKRALAQVKAKISKRENDLKPNENRLKEWEQILRIKQERLNQRKKEFATNEEKAALSYERVQFALASVVKTVSEVSTQIIRSTRN